MAGTRSNARPVEEGHLAVAAPTPAHPGARTGLRLSDALAIGLPLLVGAVSGALTVPGVTTWYRSVNKPSWTPPDAVFGPVWTVLYLAMGVSLALAWRRRGGGAADRLALGLFAVQLALNFGWSWLFFSMHALGPSVLEIAALWLAIAATIGAFDRLDRRAALLLVPYLGWVSFAGALNVAVWRLNP
ncbi:MAG: TspO/MBR family protein [Candidatus Limnocylindrales bacterium]